MTVKHLLSFRTFLIRKAADKYLRILLWVPVGTRFSNTWHTIFVGTSNSVTVLWNSYFMKHCSLFF